ARVNIGCLRPRGPDGTFIQQSKTPPISVYESDNNPVSTVFGPKQSKEFGPCAQISQSDLVDIGSGAFRFVVVGEVDYRDVFDPSTWHKTFFSQQVIVVESNLDNFSARFTDYALNCADSECPEPRKSE